MKNTKFNNKKVKVIMLSVLLSFLCLNMVAQNPPALYPYGDEFPLGLYAVSKNLADVSSKGWNNGHIYNSYHYTNLNGNPEISYNYGIALSNASSLINGISAPIPQIYFDDCKDNNMNAKGRLSALLGTYSDGELFDYAPALTISENEVTTQGINDNLSWWDFPEEQRWWKADEMNIVETYGDITRDKDAKQRPNYMYLPGHYHQTSIARYVPYLDILPVSCYTSYMDIPVTYLRWAIERTQKAITDPLHTWPLTNSNTLPWGNNMKIGKDYLNGEKSVVAILELAGLNYPTNLETVERVNHDFWLALACDVQGIELFSYHRATSNNNNFLHLHAPLASLNDMLAIFTNNDLGKVQLNGVIDNSITYNITSGPANTASYFWQSNPDNPKPLIDLQYPSIKLLAKKWMGDTYIIVVNSSNSDVHYEIPISTTTNQNGVSMLVEDLIDNITQTLNPTSSGAFVIQDELPSLGVAVFKYKSSTTLDLSIRDCLNDNGYDAGYRTDLEDIDNSPDIWVRNNDDYSSIGSDEHQQPLYSTVNGVVNNTNYVYVRVKNMSGVTSDGTETLSLYWTRNGMHPQWPDVWGGNGNFNEGNIISTETIPVLAPDEVAVIKFTWDIVADNSQVQDWGHCLLARIENTNGQDEIVDYINVSNNKHNLSKEVYYNNNIALRNCNILHPISWGQNTDNFHPAVREEIIRSVYVSNNSKSATLYDFTFQVPKYFRTSTMADSAKVSIEFNADAAAIFQPYFSETNGITTINESKVVLNSNEVTFENVLLPANTNIPIHINFDFLIQKETGAEFEYLVSQQNSSPDNTGNHERGNVRFVFKTNPMEPFTVGVGDDEDKTNPMEPFTDGAYDAVDVAVTPYIITKISPNPVSGIVNIDYSVDGASVAYIMFIKQNTGAVNTYLINTYDTQKSIQVAYYDPGTYTVLLICDGVYYSPQSLSVY